MKRVAADQMVLHPAKQPFKAHLDPGSMQVAEYNRAHPMAFQDPVSYTHLTLPTK